MVQRTGNLYAVSKLPGHSTVMATEREYAYLTNGKPASVVASPD